ENLEEFYNWVLKLKPKDLRNKGISQEAFYKIEAKIKKNEKPNLKAKIVKILTQKYKQSKLLFINFYISNQKSHFFHLIYH
ncbi:MAG: hypothetical protein QXU98_12530, partial [Candidatus Parvarchaeota archaeon]